jgi:hypothetical protein
MALPNLPNVFAIFGLKINHLATLLRRNKNFGKYEGHANDDDCVNV